MLLPFPKCPCLKKPSGPELFNTALGSVGWSSACTYPLCLPLSRWTLLREDREAKGTKRLIGAVPTTGKTTRVGGQQHLLPGLSWRVDIYIQGYEDQGRRGLKKYSHTKKMDRALGAAGSPACLEDTVTKPATAPC